MFKAILAAVALATAAVPAAAQSVTLRIADHYRGTTYLQCERPNGRIGILTDYYGRPVTRWTYRHTRGLKCMKIRLPSTRIYDRQSAGRYWDQYR